MNPLDFEVVEVGQMRSLVERGLLLFKRFIAAGETVTTVTPALYIRARSKASRAISIDGLSCVTGSNILL